MVKSFADPGTADLFHDLYTRAARRFPKDVWRRIQKKLIVLDTAQRLADIGALPGSRIEVLKGDQAGRHSIRVNDRYRLTFRFDAGDCYEVRCEDCH